MQGELARLHPAVPARKVRLIPGGVDLGRFRPLEEPARRARKAALGIPPGAPLLLSVRRLVPRMGLENLLPAFGLLLREFPALHLALGGSGPLEGRLRSLAASLGLAARVRFLGYVPEPDLPGLYAAADLFVLPTTTLEGFGLVTLEALACGTPVVGTPVGATPEILGGIDRTLVAAGATAPALAEAAGRLLRRGREGLRLLGARARERVAALYDAERVGESLEALLLGREPPRPDRPKRAALQKLQDALPRGERKFVRDAQGAIQ
jgi:glycosyltransferase involved in cell wall biosynthesis